MSGLVDALATVRAAGYVVIKAKSYRQAQERQRVAEALREHAAEDARSARVWAHNCLDEERRLRDRLTFVYGVATAKGATVEELAGERPPRPTIIPAVPPAKPSPLAELQANYLMARGHTPSTAGKPFMDALLGQAAYVQGEAKELEDACSDLFMPASVDVVECIRHEIADVALATVTLANILGVTVEDCIAEKTEHDRGRG